MDITDQFFEIKELMKFAIYNLIHSIDLFPDEYFEEYIVEHSNFQSDFNSKRLRCLNMKSTRLVDWIEKGKLKLFSLNILLMLR
ncbi:hypothetical protein QL285_011054 [Trifolium repens]|nr:hypothetical protein QL285_011054 [Trifolium repens]